METLTAVINAVIFSSGDKQKLVVLTQGRQSAMVTTVSCPFSRMLLLTTATDLISSMHRVGKNLHEGKIVLQDIMEGYQEVSCVDK